MQKNKKVKETKEVVKLVDVICNICMKSCANHKRNKNNNGGHDEYTGLIEVEVHGGFDSEVIGDMVSWRFSICEHCLKNKVISQFKIPCDIKDAQLTTAYESLKSYVSRVKKSKEADKKHFISALLTIRGLSKKELRKKNLKELHDLYWELKKKVKI